MLFPYQAQNSCLTVECVLAFYPPSWNTCDLSALFCTILFNIGYIIFPDGELGLWARHVTIQELLTHAMMLWVFRIRIHFPKHRFYLTYQTSNQISLHMNRRHWELLTDSSITNPAANIRGNTVIFSASHNKYLSFYGPIISHRNKAIWLANIFSHTAWSE